MTLCQLARVWDRRIPHTGAMIETKMDGWRGLYLRDHASQPGLYTRHGQPIEGTGHILHRLDAMERAAGELMVFDGEFVVGRTGDTLKTTKAWCERGWKSGGEAGTLFLFDCLSLAEWQAGGNDTPTYQRKARLQELWHAGEALLAQEWDWRPGSHGSDDDVHPVRVLPHAHVFEEAEVLQAALNVWSAGLEGIVVKDPMGGYRRNRCGDWRKVGRPWQHKLGWKEAA